MARTSSLTSCANEVNRAMELQSLEATSKADETKTGPSTTASQMVQNSGDENILVYLEIEEDGEGDIGFIGSLADRVKVLLETEGQRSGDEAPPESQTTDEMDVDKAKHESILETVKKGDIDEGNTGDIPNDERVEGDNHDIDKEQPIAKGPTFGYVCMPATIWEAFDCEGPCARMELLHNLRNLNVPDLGDQNLTERDLEVICDKIMSKTDSSSGPPPSPSEGESSTKKRKLNQTVEINGTTSESGTEANEERDVDTERKIEILDMSEVEGLQALTIHEVNSAEYFIF